MSFLNPKSPKSFIKKKPHINADFTFTTCVPAKSVGATI